MLFYPAKVLLKVFSISFKVLWQYCENQQKKKFHTTKDDIHVDIFTKEKKSCLINFYYSFQNCLQVQKVWLYEITFTFLIRFLYSITLKFFYIPTLGLNTNHLVINFWDIAPPGYALQKWGKIVGFTKSETLFEQSYVMTFLYGFKRIYFDTKILKIHAVTQKCQIGTLSKIATVALVSYCMDFQYSCGYKLSF